LPRADAELRQLELITHSVLSDQVKEMKANVQQPQSLKQIRCGSKCSCNGGRRSTRSGSACCASRGVEEHGMAFECGASCGCDPTRCSNRAVQKGRQHPLLLFRDVGTGWSIRALTEYKKGDYVADYCGEVKLESTSDEGTYDFSLEVPVPRETGEPDRIVVCSFEQGNEARYLAHSCSPNLAVRTSVIGRDPFEQYNHSIYFVAERNILPGESLSIDYFAGKDLDELQREQQSIDHFFSACRCQSHGCRFSEAKMEEFKTGARATRSKRSAVKTMKKGEQKEDRDIVMLSDSD
ncbi:hypothetical protein PMAYCL1PPCAC_32309, partial [Pristionchus mayeri]